MNFNPASMMWRDGINSFWGFLPKTGPESPAGSLKPLLRLSSGFDGESNVLAGICPC
jgi:hypothetical protein